MPKWIKYSSNNRQSVEIVLVRPALPVNFYWPEWHTVNIDRMSLNLD